MKKFSTKRAAALGMTSALALGTVVSAGVVAPAVADAAGTTYTCTLTGLGDKPMTVSGSLTLPSTVQAGQNLANKAVRMGVNMDPALVGSLGGVLAGLFGTPPSAIGGSASGVAFPVASSTALPVGAITIPQTPPSASGLALAGTGTTVSHRAPLTPGSYVVSMPSNFVFNAVGTFPAPVGNASLGAVPCKTNTPASLGTMKVVKATSTTTAKLVAPATRTKQGKIAATVKAAGYAARGRVAAFEGTRQLGKAIWLSSGKATIVLPLLRKGAHTITVKYLGNASAKPSTSKGVAVNVK